MVSLCSCVSEISTTSHSCYSDHIQRCVGGGGLHMSNISFGQEAEKQRRIYASVGFGGVVMTAVARHRQWTEKVQVRSQVSSVYPNVVGTWPCVSGYEMFSSKSLFYCLFFVLILRILFFTTIIYTSL